MKKTFCFIALTAILFTINPGTLKCQSLNINAANGLATNYTYCLLVDNYGYLWIGSNKGIYRYNGYAVTKYDLANGLPNSDVWWMYQDSLKRIWLYSISDQLGYIYNNKYHSTVNVSGNTLYPAGDAEANNRFSFLSMYNSQKGSSLCMVQNDTVFSYDLSAYWGNMAIENGYINVIAPTDSIFRLQYSFSEGHKLTLKKQFQFYVRGITNSAFSGQIRYLFHNYFISYRPQDTLLSIIDFNRKIYQNIGFKERVHLVCKSKRLLYVIGDSNFYSLDTASWRPTPMPIRSITGNDAIKGDKISNLIDDALWGKCLTTKSSGVFIHYAESKAFRKIDVPALTNSTCVGDGPGDVSFWWDRLAKNISFSSEGHQVKSYPHKVDNISRIIPYGQDSSLILNISKAYWLNNGTGIITPFVRGNGNDDVIQGGFDGIVTDENNIYIASQTNGFFNVRKEHGEWTTRALDYDRYKGMTYDPYRKLILLYSNDHIVVFKDNKKQAVISRELLNGARIKNIQKILADNYGNVFLKTNDRLLLIDLKKITSFDLSDNCVFDDGTIFLKKHLLIVTGKFGVLFRKIAGSGEIGNPVVTRNIKNLLYTTIEDAAVEASAVVLKTDQLFYEIPFPSANSLNSNQTKDDLPYRLIATTGNELYDLKSNDTIRVNQNDPKVQLDVINPAGVGTIVYKYNIHENSFDWSEAANNSLFLHSLKPGKFYSLSLVVQDEIWKSNKVNLQLYVIPYWWQMPSGRILLWVLGWCIGILILGFVAYTTRSIVMGINRRKNAQLELELKAIHAQINPHFIFNTLGVALYFASKNMMQEVTEHITKFSSLLRAYIKSSRNKLITLSEEITNLKNYIELQQVRFRGKFDYEIALDSHIDAEHTKIPSLLLQPIVENAINHGLFHKKGHGHLKIEFKTGENNTELVCVVEDDGIGRSAAKQINEANTKIRQSYGSDLIKDLVHIFKKYEQMDIQIVYKDKQQPSTGTIVEIKCIGCQGLY